MSVLMFGLVVLRVRRPGLLVRLLGAIVFAMGLIVLASSVLLVVGGGLVPAILGWFGIAGWAGSLRFEIPLILVSWETVFDRQARTVTARSRFLRTIRETQYRFADFEAIELRLLGSGQPDSPGVFAIVLVGPDLALDLDDPGPVPSAALFQALARIAASFDPSGRMALGASVSEFTGLALRDTTGVLERPAATPRRPSGDARWLDSCGPVLEIPRMARGMRVAAIIMMVAGTLAMTLLAMGAPPGGGLAKAHALVGLLALGLFPLAGALILSYRSGVEIDFPSRLVRRRGAFLGSRWDETYPLDRLEAVLVREVKIPIGSSPGRLVYLSGGPYEIGLYDDRSIPRSLRSRGKQPSRADRCLASAEAPAALCNLPIRVVRVGGAAPGAGHDPEPSPAPDGGGD